MVFEVIRRCLPADRRFAAISVVGVTDDPIIGIVGRVGDPVDQRGAAARRRIRDGAGEAVAYIVI